MNLLLDTHAFLWFVTDDPQLSPDQRCAMSDPSNLVFFSAISATEIAIKHGLGKLPLPEAPGTYIPKLRHLHRFAELPLEESPSLALSSLPPLHKDPFDRLLICQALVHGLTFVTSDPLIHQYQVPVIG